MYFIAANVNVDVDENTVMSNDNDEKNEDANEAHDNSVALFDCSEENPNRNIEAVNILLATKRTTTGKDADVDGKVVDIDSDGDEIKEEQDEVNERDANVSNRKKRTRRVYNGMIECNVEPIRALLTCPLCEGLYREPYTTLKCFHTLCKSCLITAIRASCNTPHFNCCPICETYFGRDDNVTNNALPDRVLETLIDKVLFPHLSHQDHMLECEFYRKRTILQKENISAVETVTGNSDRTASKTVTKDVPQVQRPPPKTIAFNEDKDRMIIFHLVPHPTTQLDEQISMLKLPFFQTSAQIRVEQIKKLLHRKLFPDSMHSTRFEIYCNGCLLEEELSLNFIYHVLWGGDTDHKINNNGDTDRNSKINGRTATLTLEYKYIILHPDEVGSEKVKG